MLTNKPPTSAGDGEKPRVIWLVNQFVPPDLAPTARLLDELSQGLAERGWKVRFLGRKATYRGAPVSGLRRWIRDLTAHARLFLQGMSGPRPNIILCLTDPPALVFTMQCLALWRGARLVHWPMDVYPQIAAALGALKEDSMIYRTIFRACSWALRRSAAVVCLDEDMRRALAPMASSTVISPWLSKDISIPENPPPPKESKIRWLYSGNLGRAHDFETLLRAQKILEDAGAPFELVFQGGGACRAAAQQLAAELGLRSCVWRVYADDAEMVSSLLAAHVLVATQREETRGLLWPSKLALLQALPRPILWVGALQGAIAASLRDRAGGSGIFAPRDSSGVAAWLMAHAEDFKSAARQPVSSDAIRSHLSIRRKESLEAWHQILTQMLSMPAVVG
jgi:colanic acid biosynthesis glycosyl transferase WcaI